MALRLAYLGPPGTFSEQAALRYAAAAALHPYPSIAAAAAAVPAGEADEAVLPIENSIEGSVTQTLDLLIHDVDLRICAEVVVDVEHCLIGPAGADLARARRVLSHPQALAQCRRYLLQALPRAAVEATLSTAGAVETAVADASGATLAIAPVRAATLYGGVVLARGIQDVAHNRTRFVVLGREDHAPSGDDKTSMVFVTRHEPGALVRVLQLFADAGVNLTKIESRPSREQLGTYVFLVDCLGHRTQPPLAAVLAAVEARTSLLKIFGSYPRFASV